MDEKDGAVALVDPHRQAAAIGDREAAVGLDPVGNDLDDIPCIGSGGLDLQSELRAFFLGLSATNNGLGNFPRDLHIRHKVAAGNGASVHVAAIRGTRRKKGQ